MGKLRKLTGAQGQIDAVNQQANAQVEAAKQAADSQVQALNSSASATAQAMATAAARDNAENTAIDAVSKPLEVADVALDEAATDSLSAVKRKQRAKFGVGVGTGVSI